MKTFLHVGCGPARKDRTTRGFDTPQWRELRLDIDSQFEPDIVGSMLDMSAVADASVDAVFSSHNIEHLYPHEVPVALREFFRVLKDDGVLVITCPDLQSVCALIADDKLTEPAYTSSAGPISPIDILYGHRPAMAKGNLYMAHRCGFTQKVLTATLQAAGFNKVAAKRRGHPKYDLHAVACKSFMTDGEIIALANLHMPPDEPDPNELRQDTAQLAQALVDQADALQQQGKLAEALDCYARALASNPESVRALSNRGNTLQSLGRLDEALASYDQALGIAPDHLQTLNNRGACLQKLRRLDEAVASYDRAISIDSRHAQALNNRALALHLLQRYEQAVASCDLALAIRPDYADARFGRANALRVLGRHDEAAADYEQVLQQRPDYPLARGLLFDSRIQCCDWRDFEDSAQVLVDEVHRGIECTTPFAFLSVSDSASAQLECARAYANARYPALATPAHGTAKRTHDRIRVAYLSGDLRQHAVSFLMAGLLEAHDRTRFETVAISFSENDGSAVERRVRAAFDRFIDVRNLSDAQVASLMRELEIDIAVDLMGYTGGNRTAVLAHRAAPVQVNYLGFPATMGAPYIDYVLADRYLIPDAYRSGYAERVVWLPDTFQANDAYRVIADATPTRAQLGLPEDGFVFCCFNNSYKIAPKVFDVWMRLLTQVEGSVLWLLMDRPAIQSNLRREAQERGVDPQRLVFAARADYPQHLARLRVADLFLDTLPFNAGTSASDALWAGLPLLTCSGQAYASRMAGSLLHAIGLAELATQSLQEYESMAFSLACDRESLADLRLRLAHNRDSQALFDTRRFTRHLESAYTAMWQRHQRGEGPASFAVDAIE